AATSPPDDCVRCHMRKAEPDDHRHADFTDHWIRKRPDEAAPPRTTFEVQPYFPETFSVLSAADRAFYTERAISLRALSVPPAAQRPMWPESEKAFRESIALGSSDPATKFFLGKALTAQGKHREAAVELEAAHAADPANHDAALAYGQSLLRQKRLDD